MVLERERRKRLCLCVNCWLSSWSSRAIRGVRCDQPPALKTKAWNVKSQDFVRNRCSILDPAAESEIDHCTSRQGHSGLPGLLQGAPQCRETAEGFPVQPQLIISLSLFCPPIPLFTYFISASLPQAICHHRLYSVLFPRLHPMQQAFFVSAVWADMIDKARIIDSQSQWKTQRWLHNST